MCFSYRNFKLRYKLPRANNKKYKLLYSQNIVLPGSTRVAHAGFVRVLCPEKNSPRINLLKV